MGAMGRRLIRGLSGAAVFLVSTALLSMRHRGAQETAHFSGLTEGTSEKPQQWSKENLEEGGGRGQKDLQVHPPEGYRTEGSLSLGDIFIAVKTTKRFHQSRMELLLDTWISRAREQVSVWVWTRERVLGNGARTGCQQGERKPKDGDAGHCSPTWYFASFSLIFTSVRVERGMLPSRVFHW